MSKPNSIPEFLGIMAGTVVVMAVVGTAIGMIFEKIKTSFKNNQNSNLDEKQSLKIKQSKTVDIFVKNTNLIQKEPLRYMSGSPGETSRVLTNNYYSLFFDGNKTIQNAHNLLEYRNSALRQMGFEMNEDLIEIVSEKYFNKVSILIFCICYHENEFGQVNLFQTNDSAGEVYKVILEEHNKICPSVQVENNDYNYDLMAEIMRMFNISKFGESFYDNENYDDNFYEDEDYEDEDERDSMINKIIIKDFEKLLIEEILKYIPNNPAKDSPLEGITLMSKMRSICDMYKEVLISKKHELDITDSDIEYIISKSYENCYSRFLQ